jgi:hypothetical protein
LPVALHPGFSFLRSLWDKVPKKHSPAAKNPVHDPVLILKGHKELMLGDFYKIASRHELDPALLLLGWLANNSIQCFVGLFPFISSEFSILSDFGGAVRRDSNTPKIKCYMSSPVP